MLSVGSAIGVSGCAPREPAPGPTPSPTLSAPPGTAPVLPTNEEALAIVEELVPAAIAAEVRAGTTGDFAELETLAGPDYVTEARTGAENMAAESLHITGQIHVDSFAVQSVSVDHGLVVIRTYGCYDISSTQLVDATGTNVRGSEVPVRVPVVFRVQTDPLDFKLMETSPWPSSTSC